MSAGRLGERLEALLARARPLEHAYAVVALVAISGVGFDAVRANASTGQPTISGLVFVPMKGSGLLFALQGGLMIPAALLAWGRRAAFLETSRANLFAWLAAALALASTAWSVVPVRTLGLAAHLLAGMVFACWLAARFDLREQLRILVEACAVLVGLSWLFVLALPQFGLSQDPWTLGAWQGAFSQKNALGQVIGLAALAGGLGAASRAVPRWAGALLAAAALALLPWSRSLGPALACGGAVAVVAALWALAKARPALRVGVTLAALALPLAAPFSARLGVDRLSEALGRESTVNGRTLLWSRLSDYALDRPALGYGYLSFWRGTDAADRLGSATSSDKGYQYDPRVSWKVWHAHNGPLEVLLGLGALGLLLVLCHLALVGARAAAGATGPPAWLWPAALWTFVVIVSVTEVPLVHSLHPEGVEWLALAAAAGTLARESRAGARAAAAQGPSCASR